MLESFLVFNKLPKSGNIRVHTVGGIVAILPLCNLFRYLLEFRYYLFRATKPLLAQKFYSC